MPHKKGKRDSGGLVQRGEKCHPVEIDLSSFRKNKTDINTDRKATALFIEERKTWGHETGPGAEPKKKADGAENICRCCEVRHRVERR